MLKLVIACIGCGEVYADVPILGHEMSGILRYDDRRAYELESGFLRHPTGPRWFVVRNTGPLQIDDWACADCFAAYEAIRVAMGGEPR